MIWEVQSNEGGMLTLIDHLSPAQEVSGKGGKRKVPATASFIIDYPELKAGDHVQISIRKVVDVKMLQVQKVEGATYAGG